MRFTVIVVVGVLASVALPARAGEEQHPGRPLYLKYCGACHGPQGKGDGIVATFMRPKPPDLTLIAAGHGGEFPLQQVVKAIDGRDIPHAHGEPAMPVWGQILSQELGDGKERRIPIERRVQGRVLSIAEYLETIQVK